MQIEYKIRTVGCSFAMDIMPNSLISGEVELIGAWLYDDVQNDGKKFLPEIDKVLAGEIEVYDCSSPMANSAMIYKEKSIITCNFEECNDEPCTLPTTMLREIVEIWIKECEKFSKTKKR